MCHTRRSIRPASVHVLPAIDIQRLPGNKAGARRQKEHHRTAEILWILMPLNAAVGWRGVVLGVIARRGYLCVGQGKAGRDRVDGDVVRSDFASQRPGQSDNAGLGGRVMQSVGSCLLYTSPSPRDATLSRMPSSA